MFKPVDPKTPLPSVEKKLLEYWKKENIFQQSIDNRPADKRYTFYDGPPFATGLPHYGHILAGTIKDVIPRYQTMRGYRVDRRFGWDCHGLPVENVVEKKFNLTSKKEIEEKFGIAAFNEQCRADVLQYTAEWEATVERMGRWVDFKNDYKTMDPEYMESIWWVFRQLWDKDLIYRGHKVMWVSPPLATPLSNFEVSLGYKEVKDSAVTWKFQLKDEPDTYLLAWTTTPWSTLSTMGLAIGDDHTYLKVQVGDEKIVFVKEQLETILSGIEEYEILEEFKGEKLVNKSYHPIVDYYKDLPEVKNNQNAYKVHATDYVETSSGTGIVTINGSYGEVDMEAVQKIGLPFILDLEMSGHFNDLAQNYSGMHFKEAERKIIEYGQENNQIWKVEKYKHSYPHCWRTDAPLINYATSSWFVNVEKIKEQMLLANQDTHWVPDDIKNGRFGQWLENARDWCISRNRFWGAPLPVWIAEDDENDMICIGSIKELEDFTEQKVTDLHKHFVDNIIIIKNGKKYHRIPEVLDCWFESGAMPYAQNHYPFENQEMFDANFPAEFIAEGLDQTRGWFYTLVVLGTALFNKAPFKNVIVNGLILAEDGKKMSKRLQNYPDPNKVFEDYGADALRLYLMNSPVVRAQALRFSERGVEEVVRKILLPLWNSYSFFVTYANIDNWEPKDSNRTNPPEVSHSLDRFIISELEALTQHLTTELDQYHLQKAAEPIVNFIDSLTNWYIRRSRRRFWKSENDTDKDQAYQTLYYVLTKLSKIIAPFTPFIAEEIFRNLTDSKSVHLEDWPEAHANFIDHEFNRTTAIVRKIINLGHSIRAQEKIKVRQPLSNAEIILEEDDFHRITKSEIEVIKEELNIKEVEITTNAHDLICKTISINASIIGPKLGSEVQKIIQDARDGKYELTLDGKVQIGGHLLEEGEFELKIQGKEGVNLAHDDGVAITLNTVITPDLEAEGYARDIIRHIQDTRKEENFNVDDRIIIIAHTDNDDLRSIINSHQDYIKTETLAKELHLSDIQQAKPIKLSPYSMSVSIVISK
ncbi:isoleucine--tRNA ligase [Candidatus Peregrinibacteria bacterium HGW-Peregrinibacteria-1]|jgi:isoleucyl-tRNA synthetase|nr:MAG: isoleucine--tRNA ligase [Candidatus Peregrinibacteria bacterium HGW-Peregrinibacteria-1]